MFFFTPRSSAQPTGCCPAWGSGLASLAGLAGSQGAGGLRGGGGLAGGPLPWRKQAPPPLRPVRPQAAPGVSPHPEERARQPRSGSGLTVASDECAEQSRVRACRGCCPERGGWREAAPSAKPHRGASSGAGASAGLSASPGATGGWRARDVSGPACRGRPGPGRSAPWSLSPSRWLGLRRQASGRGPVCPSPHPRQVAAARTRPGTPGARGCEAWVSGAGKQRDTQSLWGGPGPGVRLRSLTGSRVLGLLGASSPGTGRTEASPEEGDRENNGAPTRGAWRGSCRLGRESEMSPHRTTLSGRLAGSQGGSGPFGGRDFPRAGEGQGSRAQPPPAHAGDQGLPPAVLARCR